MARSPTTSDVFNAIAEVRRREILDALMQARRRSARSWPTSRCPSLRCPSTCGCSARWDWVKCRAQGRHRLYSLEPARLRPLHEWLARYEQIWNERLDRMDDYLKELQKRENSRDT